MRRITILVALVALAAPGSALAHATLRKATPNYGQRLGASPTRIVLTFDQSVTLIPNALRVLDERGRAYAGRIRLGPEGRSIYASLRRLGRGGYTVRWQVFSRDGHIISGVYTFGVRAPAPQATEAYGASGPTATEDVVRWLAFVGLALVLGGIGFRLFVLPGAVPPRLERRFFVVSLGGAVGVIEVGVVAFLLRADGALQVPFAKFLYSDLSPLVRTRFGTAFVAMTLGFVVVTALLFLAWLTGRAVLLWPAFAVALGFASGFSLSGHSSAEPNSSSWSALADWVHLGAASLWAGGLVMLLVTVVSAPELWRTAFARFARLAPVLMALLVAAGVYLSLLRLPALGDLWTTGYGQVLIVKLSLVALALAWGGFHHFVVEPRLHRPGIASRLPRSLAGEAAVGMAVLLVAAILVNSAPPPVSGANEATPPVVSAP